MGKKTTGSEWLCFSECKIFLKDRNFKASLEPVTHRYLGQVVIYLPLSDNEMTTGHFCPQLSENGGEWDFLAGDKISRLVGWCHFQ